MFERWIPSGFESDWRAERDPARRRTEKGRRPRVMSVGSLDEFESGLQLLKRGHIAGAVLGIDIGDFPLFVDDVDRSVVESPFLIVTGVHSCDPVGMIRDKLERERVKLRPLVMGIFIVAADRKYFGVEARKGVKIVPHRAHFLRAAAAPIGGRKRQDGGSLSEEG